MLTRVTLDFNVISNHNLTMKLPDADLDIAATDV
jgi:hypothetical protein